MKITLPRRLNHIIHRDSIELVFQVDIIATCLLCLSTCGLILTPNNITPHPPPALPDSRLAASQEAKARPLRERSAPNMAARRLLCREYLAQKYFTRRLDPDIFTLRT